MIHITTAHHLRFLAWLAPLAVTLAACESTGPGTRALSLSVTTKSGTPAASPSSDPPAGSTVTSLTVSAAQVTVREVELAPVGTTCVAEQADAAAAGTTSDDGSNEEHDDCEELELGPLTVDLPLDATTQLVLDALVPAGTYRAVEAKLNAVNVSGSFMDAGGTHSFTFTSNAEAEIEMEFATPITVGPGTSNFTVSVDVASWFKDASGNFLDPNDPANAETINANIRHSFRAFADEDHDGVDDDHEEDSGH